MKRVSTLVMAMTFACNVFAQTQQNSEVFVQTVSSKKNNSVFVEIRNTSTAKGIVHTYRLCQVQGNASQCSFIGSADGYTDQELKQAQSNLRGDEMKQSAINFAVIAGVMVVGAVTGFKIFQGHSVDKPSANGLFALVNDWGRGAVGSVGAAATLGTVANLVLPDPDTYQQIRAALGNRDDARQIVPMSIDQFVERLSESLASVNK